MGNIFLGPKHKIEQIKGSYVYIPTAPTIELTSVEPAKEEQILPYPQPVNEPVYIEKIVYVDRIIEVPVDKPIEIEKIVYVDKPVEVIKHEKIIHEVEKEVVKFVDKIVHVELIKYVFPLWGKLLVGVPLVLHIISKWF